MPERGAAFAVSSRADLAALACAAIFPSVATWLYIVALAEHPSAVVKAAYAAEKALQFAFPPIWIVLVRRQKVQFPLLRRAGVVAGLAFGAVVFAGTLLLYFYWLEPSGYLATFAGQIRVKAAPLGMGTPGGFVLGAAMLSSAHALLEEYYWRWFLFGGLRRYMPTLAAVLLSSLAFTAHHLILLTTFFDGAILPATFFSLCVFVGGAVWAWLYQRSGSLLGPWLSHLLIDAGIFVVGYRVLWG